jgi:hypothetical protein
LETPVCSKERPDPDERVSLAPLDPEVALRSLLATDPKEADAEDADSDKDADK